MKKSKFEVGDTIKASSRGWGSDTFTGTIKCLNPVIIDLIQDNTNWQDKDFTPSDGMYWVNRYCRKISKLERALK